jgi:hypothetical protein
MLSRIGFQSVAIQAKGVSIFPLIRLLSRWHETNYPIVIMPTTVLCRTGHSVESLVVYVVIATNCLRVNERKLLARGFLF